MSTSDEVTVSTNQDDDQSKGHLESRPQEVQLLTEAEITNNIDNNIQHIEFNKLTISQPPIQDINLDDAASSSNHFGCSKVMKAIVLNKGDQLNTERLESLKNLSQLLFDQDQRFVTALIESVALSDIETTVQSLYTIFSFGDYIIPWLKNAISAEVNRTAEGPTLFRGNTTASRMMTAHTKRIAEEYMLLTILPPIQIVCNQEYLSLEVDPGKMSESDRREDNQAALEKHTKLFIDKISQSVEIFPKELCDMYSFLKEEVSAKFPKMGREIIAGFIFLRLFNPFIVSPDKVLKVTPKSRRNLILITKVLQNIANNVEFGEKEPFMSETNFFIAKHSAAISEFLDDISEKKNNNDKEDTTELPQKKVNEEDLLKAIDYIYLQARNNSTKIQENLSKNSDAKSQSKMEKQVQSLNDIIATLGEPPLYTVGSSPEPSKVSETSLTPQEAIYQQYLTKSHKEDFTDMKALNAIFLAGKDIQGRSVVVIVAEKIPVKLIDMDKFLLYIIHVMDPIVQSDYVLIYYHAPLDSNHRPNFNWLRSAYGVFSRKYKKNVKEMYVVRPSMWFRIVVGTFRPFISGKFWNKLKYVDSPKGLLPLFNDSFPTPIKVLKLDK